MVAEAGNPIHQIVVRANKAAPANLIGLLDRSVRQTERIEGILPVDPKAATDWFVPNSNSCSIRCVPGR